MLNHSLDGILCEEIQFLFLFYLFILIFAELTFVLLQLEHRLSLMDPSKVMMMMVTMVTMVMMMMMMMMMMSVMIIMMMIITGANVKSDYVLIHLANCGEVTEQIDDEISRFLLIFGLI